MYDPHGHCMSFCSPLLTDGRGRLKQFVSIRTGTNFPAVQGVELLWNESTNSSATGAARDSTGVGLINVKFSTSGGTGQRMKTILCLN